MIRKKQIIWLMKLAGLTLAIYWFMTQGLTTTLGQSVSSSSPNQNAFTENGLMLGSLLLFLALLLIHDIKEHRAKRPKANR
ncbi:hypothetical protein [Dielma fastidiosa]|uniref:hypothetical protein n=1 Tax=Dielma fastidiosa TaxID=1034346 RepID=UPI00356521AC